MNFKEKKRRRKISVMARVRPRDLQRVKELAKDAQKKLPDFWGELIKVYKEKKGRG